MFDITMKLQKKDLNEAVAQWLAKKGFAATDKFCVTVRTIPGDRPFDAEYTEITATGIVAGSA